MATSRFQLDDNNFRRKSGSSKWSKRQFNKLIRRSFKRFGKNVYRTYRGWMM